MNWDRKQPRSWSVDVIKAGLHYYQSFCDHSRNFALVNSEIWTICKKQFLRELTQC